MKSDIIRAGIIIVGLLASLLLMASIGPAFRILAKAFAGAGAFVTAILLLNQIKRSF